MGGELPGLFVTKEHPAEYVAASLISHVAPNMFLEWRINHAIKNNGGNISAIYKYSTKFCTKFGNIVVKIHRFFVIMLQFR
jgi:hypothetical protein